jgi:hypothetical protein
MRRANFWLGLLFLVPGLAVAAPGHRIETYGDSLTAGFLSETSLLSPPPLKEISGIVSDLIMYRLTEQDEYLASHHAPKRAWPYQLAEHLRQDGSIVDLQNKAISGTAAVDLVNQLVAPSADATAFFFTGHNDLCENPEPVDELIAHFEVEYDSALAKWDASHTGSTAYLMPVSRIDQVYDTMRGHVWYQGKQGQYSCEDNWKKFFPYCPSFYRMLKEGKLEAFIVARSDAMNLALQRLVEKWNRASKSNTFLFLTMEVKFTKEFFSVDCYHLGKGGQAWLGEAVFKKLYF